MKLRHTSDERNSAIELLRLICIFGILMMHVFGDLQTPLSTFNTAAHVLVNSLFNTGVTCFILISGYFGIRFSVEKLVRLDLMIIFFSVTGTLATEGFAVKALMKAVLPVLTRQYWFITCYFALCILAPFLNRAVEKMTKEWFGKLLFVLLFLFSLVPTFGLYDIMQDAGKGLVHFVMIYLLGRYLALYENNSHKTSRLLLGLFLCVGFIFAADLTLTVRGQAIYNTCSRDCSLFIIFASVLLLFLFQQMNFHCAAINHIAGDVLAIYVLDRFIRTILNRFVDLGAYGAHPALLLFAAGYVLTVMAAAILLNELRKLTIGHIEPWLVKWITLAIHKIGTILLSLFQIIRRTFIGTE